MYTSLNIRLGQEKKFYKMKNLDCKTRVEVQAAARNTIFKERRFLTDRASQFRQGAVPGAHRQRNGVWLRIHKASPRMIFFSYLFCNLKLFGKAWYSQIIHKKDYHAYFHK